ncbi:Ig-like domain-containing protein [Tenacibaculum ovolyticum]|uniref:Ig-like domain-containing protein n=1 Tax=Tenacibaculum ovolyticum TaxID=104270 RepID=UPI0022F3DE2F|nr:Ig-like domain-containing protein [Tenacibaculum ovolyticum]WBX77500.1 Ig-like domain-containing protein [Tenacibaculum ovolyticum]
MKKYYLKLLLIPFFAISMQLYGQTPSTMEFGSSTVVIANSSNPSHDFSSNSLSSLDNAKLNGFDMSATTSGSIFLAFALNGNSAGTSIIGAPSDAVLGWIGNAAASVIDGTLKTDTGGEIGITSMHFAYEIAGGSSPSSFTFTGKKDGAPVGTLVLNSPTALSDITLDFTSPTTGSFANIDEIVFKPSSAILGGFSIDGIVIVAAVSNTAPVIAGMSAGQTVNDNATVSPFSTITTTDADGDNLSATITLDTNAKGVLSGTGLTGTGPYAIASTTPADLQAKLRALSYNPTDNRTSTSETTTFTVVINDATVTDTNNTTTVISSAVAPTVTSVSASTANGNFKAGDNVVVTATFSEAVTVTGTPQITLETGTTDRTINYNGTGSGTNTLQFTYTIQAGDVSADLDYVGTSSLTAGTSIQDTGSKDATLTLASPGAANSLGANKALVIDGNAPRVTSIARQTPATSPTNADAVTFRITFDENVQGVGAADFTITGASGVSIGVVGSNTTYDITFSGGDLASVNSTITLGFAGGQNITDISGNALTNLTPTGTNNNTFVVNNTAPRISSIARQSPTTSPTNADALVWDVTFDQVVANVDAADFAVIGTTGTIASVTNPSGNVYRVTASGGDLAGLNATVTLGFAGGQNIADASGNTLTNLTPTGTNNNTFVVNNTAPRISSIARQSPTTSPTNADALVWDVTFDQAVANVDAADFAVIGTTGTIASVTNPSGNVYRITASGGDLAGLNATVTLGFAGGQNIADASGNALTNLTPTGTNNNTFVVDNNGPTLTSSNPADDGTGAVLNQDITLTFNENISKGTGNILIKKMSDNSTIETIDITTAAVIVSTTTATINPASDFDLNTGYYIQIDNTAFKDALNNNYAGISDATSLNFTSQANQTNSYAVASGNWSVPSNWSLGRLPISTDNVNVGTNTINLDVSNVTINDLSISIGGAFNILSGQSITIEGNLNQNGTLNILSNASNSGSLIVKGNHTGISNVDYHRYLSTNWHLIASPITGKNISDFTGNLNTSGNKYSIAPYQNNVVSASRWNYYTTAAGSNNIATAGTFTIGKGYSIQKNTGGTLNFSGTLNTTDKTFPITDGGDNPAGNRWNLVGNPFTASLNGSNAADAANNFLKVNIDAGNLDPSRAGLYLWNGTTYVEKSVDDAAFYIAPGQGFFVHAPDAGGTSVSFTEAMETHQTGNIFLRGSGKSYPEIVLNINEGKNSSSTKIRYINNKTKGLDPGSDVGTFTGTNASFKVFSHLIDNNKGIDFAIQALPNQDYESTIIPIGLKAKAGKAVVFSAEVSNLPNGIEMYLEDRVNNTFTNLSKEDYTITLKTNTNSIGQFYIHTSAKNLEAIDVTQNLESVSIYKSANNTLTVAGLQTNKASVNVYSILGQKVISTALKSSGSHVIQLPKAATGVYIVELNSNLGKISKKIILE